MKLGLLNREQFSGALAESLDALIGQIQGGWGKEHLKNGKHKGVSTSEHLSIGTRLLLKGYTTERATGLTVLDSDLWSIDLTKYSVIRLHPGANLDITGLPIFDDQTKGQTLILINVSAFTITLKHENAGSPVKHRILTPDGLNMTLPGTGGAALAWYDEVNLRWRVLPFLSGIVTGTNTGDQFLFSTIAVSGQSNIVADAVSDTFTMAAGLGIVLTTVAGTDTLTIAGVVMTGDSGSGGVAGLVPAPAAGDAGAGKFLKADGTWAVPPGSGSTVQTVNTETGAQTTGTTVVPLDNTIPQNTEGDQYMSLSITPKHVSNLLRIDVVAFLIPSVQAWVTGALFQDSTAGALASFANFTETAGAAAAMTFTHYMTAGTTSATTFKFRAGMDRAGTTAFNGSVAGRLFGGVMASSITITEIPATATASTLGSLLDLIFRRKASDESVTSSTVLQDDDDLTFPVLANQVWVVNMWLYVFSASSTPRMNYRLSVPAGATVKTSQDNIIFSTAANSGSVDLFSQASASEPNTYVASSGPGGSAQLVQFHAIVVVGATAGTVKLQWAQNVSNGNPTIVQANSHLIAQRFV